ncbi:uncharacterized protein C1orf100-like [Cyprinodon tularosa]|uniref:uncharacterized protein C1orf100-like n=1 Tax=Cyprinodon tularosa TaxID=77115 RepID=UPI0018E1DA46|nr:uncharacterized protein C1orf100-like [Cyprinodon tularosa]
MAGSGIALRLHEFREPQDCKDITTTTVLTKRTSRLGRDVQGLYPGQLARVHNTLSKDCGESSSSLRQPVSSPNYQPSFDLQILRILSHHRHNKKSLEQCDLQTTYQEHFGLLSPCFPQS